jgi:hypothetical protein
LKQPILHDTDDSGKTHCGDWPQQCLSAMPEVLQALKHCLVLRVLPSQLTLLPKDIVLMKHIKTISQTSKKLVTRLELATG